MSAAQAGPVSISIPRESGFAAVAGLVLGGVAARHEVTIDVLDDLQLALDSLLDHEEDEEGQITVVVHIDGDRIETTVGPVGDRVLAELERDADDGIGLRRLLGSTVDGVEVVDREGGRWVQLSKGYA